MKKPPLHISASQYPGRFSSTGLLSNTARLRSHCYSHSDRLAPASAHEYQTDRCKRASGICAYTVYQEFTHPVVNIISAIVNDHSAA